MTRVLILLLFPVLLSGQVIPEDQEMDYVLLKNGERLEQDIIKVAAAQIWIQEANGSTRKIDNKEIENWKNHDLSLIEFHRNDNNEIEYSEVVQVEGMTKTELYNAARLWYADYFQDSKEVLELDDREGGVLIGTGWGDLYYRSNIGLSKQKLWKTIKIQVKDGRYKYTIQNIEFESYPGQYTSVQKNALDNSPVAQYPKVKKPKSKIGLSQKSMKEATLKSLQGTCDRLKEGIKKHLEGDDDDW